LAKIESTNIHASDQASASAYRFIVTHEEFVPSDDVLTRHAPLMELFVAHLIRKPRCVGADLWQLLVAPVGPLLITHVLDLADPVLVFCKIYDMRDKLPEDVLSKVAHNYPLLYFVPRPVTYALLEASVEPTADTANAEYERPCTADHEVPWRA
jgi:hypothetical protein